MKQIMTIIVAGFLSLSVFSADRLSAGERLMMGDALASANGKYILKLGADGNLELYEQEKDSKRRIWASNAFSAYAKRLMMERNGNLTIRDTNNKILWQSHTRGGKNSYAVVQDDGNFVIYNITDPVAVWATGTNRAESDTIPEEDI